MSKNFIVLSEQQTEWMRRAVKQMIELAGYYSLTKFPMDEADCDNIVNTFSSYTKKSRNNGMIIHCANALSEYLERIGNQTGKYSKLDVHQMARSTGLSLPSCPRMQSQRHSDPIILDFSTKERI